MDGSPSRGETIPIRLFLGGFDLTPTFREVNKKYSTRYYLSLVLIDEGTTGPLNFLYRGIPVANNIGRRPTLLQTIRNRSLPASTRSRCRTAATDTVATSANHRSGGLRLIEVQFLLYSHIAWRGVGHCSWAFWGWRYVLLTPTLKHCNILLEK